MALKSKKMTENKYERLLIILAFGAIYIVWGSTYLFSFYAISEIPPFMMVGYRFFIAGFIMYSVGLFFGFSKPTWIQWKNALITALLFLVFGTSGLVWSLQFVDTGISSLIVALEPLIIVFLVWKVNKQAPTWQSLLGVALGISGMLTLVWQEQFLTDEMTLIGIGIILIGLVSWGIGTILIPKLDLPKSKPQTAAMQMLIGGAVLLIFSFTIGEFNGFKIDALSSRAIYSLFFLVFFGSIISFSSFNYLLVKVSPEKVATSTYVNPVVAVSLGWGFNGEVITTQSFLAATLLLTGVVFIIKSKKKVVV